MVAENRSRATSVLVNYFAILPSPSEPDLHEPGYQFSFFSFGIKLVISECNSVYCLNGGSCRDEPSGYKCDCRFGFYGKRCEGEFSRFLLCLLLFFCLFFSVHPKSLGKGKNHTVQNETMMVFAFDCLCVRCFQSTIRSILK